MIPAACGYAAPDTVEEAVALLAAHGDDARPIAGGQSLIPMLRFRLLTPALLVDLRRIAGLDRVEAADAIVTVGALATHHLVGTHPALAPLAMFADAAEHIGDVQIRNRGTFVGSLTHADPAGDWPAVALAADAAIHITGPTGPRTASVNGFFWYAFTPGLERGEIVTAARIPLPARGLTSSAYVKVAHPASGYALAGVAARVTVDAGAVTDARVAATGVGVASARLPAVERALVGGPFDDDAVAAAAAAAADGVEAVSDDAATGDYRLHLLRVSCKRALQRSLDRMPPAR